MRLRPVTIKGFKVGQNMAVLILHHGRNREPYLKEGLVESCGHGERAYIFPKMEEAEDYVEKYNLIIWLLRLTDKDIGKYSLQQLRKVKEILGEGD